MSAGPKAAAFAAMLRIFIVGYAGVGAHIQTLFWILSVATMTVGNIMALRQSNIKRMLAFSSIAHAGYILIALAVSSSESSSAAALYLLAYALTNLGAFMVIALVDSASQHDEFTTIDSFTGLARKRPYLGLALTLFLLSLAGFPPTAGFMGKFVLFKAAVDQGYYMLVVIAVMNSLVSVFYYLRVVVKMFMSDAEEQAVEVPAVPAFLMVALVFAVAAVFLIGVYPQAWFNFAGLSILGGN